MVIDKGFSGKITSISDAACERTVFFLCIFNSLLVLFHFNRQVKPIMLNVAREHIAINYRNEVFRIQQLSGAIHPTTDAR